MTLKKQLQYSTLFLLLSNFAFAKDKAPQVDPVKKGLELAVLSDKANSGFNGESSEMEMVIINALGDKISRKMLSKTKETKSDGDKSIVTFLWPADVKGTKMLTWTHKTRDDDQWLFMPAIKRVKRISSRNKTGSFMGSEFSYEDLGSQEVEKFTYKFIKEDNVNGRAVDVFERYPVDKKSGYSKQVVFQDKEYLNALKVEYYDRKNELLKTATFSGYAKNGKWWRAKEIKMDNHQTKKSSILTWNTRELGKNFKERDFHKNKLKK